MLASYDERFANLDVTLNIYDIQDTNIPPRKPGELNVLICVENCLVHKHYRHYNKYGDYDDPMFKSTYTITLTLLLRLKGSLLFRYCGLEWPTYENTTTH